MLRSFTDRATKKQSSLPSAKVNSFVSSQDKRESETQQLPGASAGLHREQIGPVARDDAFRARKGRLMPCSRTVCLILLHDASITKVAEPAAVLPTGFPRDLTHFCWWATEQREESICFHYCWWQSCCKAGGVGPWNQQSLWGMPGGLAEGSGKGKKEIRVGEERKNRNQCRLIFILPFADHS